MRKYVFLSMIILITSAPLLKSCGPIIISPLPQSPPPVWFYPGRIETVRYVYFPNYVIYYDLSARNYLYLENNIWRRVTVLPPKYQSINLVSNGGWHFSNLKSIEELERKFLNDENHSEYELQGFDIDRIKENIKNRSIDYNHNAKQDSLDRFSPTKLQVADIDILPNYLKKNLDKYKEWLD